VSGEPLRGEQTYRRLVPPNVPAKQHWAATLYNLSTASFLRDSLPGSEDDRLASRAEGDASEALGVAGGAHAGRYRPDRTRFVCRWRRVTARPRERRSLMALAGRLSVCSRRLTGPPHECVEVVPRLPF
jgi:hypothetical protein